MSLQKKLAARTQKQPKAPRAAKRKEVTSMNNASNSVPNVQYSLNALHLSNPPPSPSIASARSVPHVPCVDWSPIDNRVKRDHFTRFSDQFYFSYNDWRLLALESHIYNVDLTHSCVREQCYKRGLITQHSVCRHVWCNIDESQVSPEDLKKWVTQVIEIPLENVEGNKSAHTVVQILMCEGLKTSHPILKGDLDIHHSWMSEKDALARGYVINELVMAYLDPTSPGRSFMVNCTRQAASRFYVCMQSGRHHRCNGKLGACPFAIHIGESTVSLNNRICLFSARELDAGEYDCDEVLSSEGNRRQSTLENPINFEQLQRSGAIDKIRPLSRNPLDVKNTFICVTSQRHRELTSRALHGVRRPWANALGEVNSVSLTSFFGHSVDPKQIGPDELSPHWLHLVPSEYIDLDCTQIPSDDYWHATVLNQMPAIREKLPQLCATLVNAGLARKSHIPVITGSSGTPSKVKSDSRFVIPDTVLRGAMDAQSAQRTRIMEIRGIAAKHINRDLQEKALATKFIPDYTASVAEEICRWMCSYHALSSSVREQAVAFMCAKLKSDRCLVEQAEAVGRHAMAIILLSGMWCNTDAWSKVMGSGSNGSSFSHQRIKNNGLLTTCLEVGIEYYLYCALHAEVQSKFGFTLERQLTLIKEAWIQNAIFAGGQSNSDLLLEPLI